MSTRVWDALLHVLQDGRWHQLSTESAYRLITTFNLYEVQQRPPPRRVWEPASASSIGQRPRTMYRARLRPEHVRQLPKLTLTDAQRRGLNAIQSEMTAYADVKHSEGSVQEANDIRAALAWLRTV